MKLSHLELDRVTARLPPEEKEGLQTEAPRNLTPVNAEIMRSIRFRREAEQQAAR